MKQTVYEDRIQAIALLRAGHAVADVAAQLQRTPQWVRKIRRRFDEQGPSGLVTQSRTPKRPGNQLPRYVWEAVILARVQLEAAAETGAGLKYIGGPAIRTVLKEQRIKPLPSVPSIERILRQAGLTRPKAETPKPVIHYPHLRPQQPHELIQVDIVPHYLRGGERVACFNGLDVVSRYPTGHAFRHRRSGDAAAFLIHLWQTLGIPRYTQVDNEGCFSGGATHPHVLGHVVRLALLVGTELVFSPCYHPQSNGYVERFHQDYNRHVWEDTYLADLATVQQQAQHFFDLYRHSGHHSQLQGQTPAGLHLQVAPKLLPLEYACPLPKLPLTTGKIHFMRRVQADATVRVLNVDWAAPMPPDTGVWVTLDIQSDKAWLSIYDAAPDDASRTCITVHPFPLKDMVVPSTIANSSFSQQSKICASQEAVRPFTSTAPQRKDQVDSFFRKAYQLAADKLLRTFFRSDQLVE